MSALMMPAIILRAKRKWNELKRRDEFSIGCDSTVHASTAQAAPWVHVLRVLDSCSREGGCQQLGACGVVAARSRQLALHVAQTVGVMETAL